MEGQWSLWPQVSEGCDGTSRLHSWGDAGLVLSLSQGEGWDPVVPAWRELRDCMEAHGCPPAQVLSRWESTTVPMAWSCGSAPPGTRWGHPWRGGGHGAKDLRGVVAGGPWDPRPEEYLGPEDSGSSARPCWPTHGDVGMAWLASFCQHLRCASLSCCDLVFQQERGRLPPTNAPLRREGAEV